MRVSKIGVAYKCSFIIIHTRPQTLRLKCVCMCVHTNAHAGMHTHTHSSYI